MECMINKIDLFRKFFQINKASKYFVAASGGLDSMVLIHLMISEKLPIHLLHVNYNLRGNDSFLDAELISNFCKNNSIPLTTKNVELKLHLEKNGGNLQNEARKVRYSFFNEIQSKTKDSKVVIAHHQDDQIETFWIQLLRDAGISGLAGMKEVNEIFLRPLLHFTKYELKSYAQLHSIKWREDASNSKNDYLRNRLRNEIIPSLSSKIPTLNNSILCLQQIFQSQISDDDEMLEILKRKIQNEQKIDFEDLRRLNSIQTIELFKKLSVPIFVYKELNKLIEAQKGAKILWNNNQNCLIKEVDYLSLSINKKELNEMPQLIITITDSLPSTFNKSTYYFDAQNVKGKIQVRFWQKGDRLQPIGLNGSKLVSDILTDAKVANNERNEQFVLFDEEKILACHGHSIDKRALATKQSISIFRVELKIDKNSSYSRP